MWKPRPPTSGSRQAGERGSASIQMVVLLPALFAVMFLGMQAALFYHARTVAIAAAQQGARAAAGENGSTSNGVSAASDFISHAGGEDVLVDARASAHRTATTVTVAVTGHALSVIPGWTPAVVQSASLPVERLTAP